MTKSEVHMLVFVAQLGALREQYFAIKDHLSYTDKYIVSNGMKSIDRMFKRFEGEGLSEDRVYDGMVDAFQSVSGEITKKLEELYES